MIVHILRFAFKDGVRDEDKAAGLEAISGTAALDSVSFSSIGQNLGGSVDGYSHAYCVGIADLVSLDRYMNDPIHRAGDFVFAPLVARIAIFDMSDDLDPELGSKIMAMHERRSTSDPEWGRLFGTIPEVRIYA